MQPIVLITTDRKEPVGFIDSPRIRPMRPYAWVYEAYVNAVRASGGVPVLVPPGETDLDALLLIADAVVLTGGDMDIHPSLYGETIKGRIDRIEPSRTLLELELARRCLDNKLPVLGICGGMQVLAVAAGGSLIQDLKTPSETEPHLIAHEQPNDPATPSHEVLLTGISQKLLPTPCFVNSTHHQAIKSPGSFTVVGRAPDDVVEIIHLLDHPFAVGIQWHPELLGQLGPYQALIEAATHG